MSRAVQRLADLRRQAALFGVTDKSIEKRLESFKKDMVRKIKKKNKDLKLK